MKLGEMLDEDLQVRLSLRDRSAPITMARSEHIEDLEAQMTSRSGQRTYGHATLGWLRKAEATAQRKERLPSPRLHKIELYPKGYPRFAGFIGSEPAFAISRRFSAVRARLLLQKQHAVSRLEEQLFEIDSKEPRVLYLGSMQRDQNSIRKQVLDDLNVALADYDELLERNARILNMPTATERQRKGVFNWIVNTGSMCRKEISFIGEADVCSLMKQADSGLFVIEQLVERVCIAFLTLFRMSPPSSISEDPQVFVFRKTMLKCIARILMSGMIMALLLVPVIIIRMSRDAALQVPCLLVASGLFLFTLSSVVNARTTDMFIAGPTYAAILVAFMVSGANRY